MEIVLGAAIIVGMVLIAGRAMLDRSTGDPTADRAPDHQPADKTR